MLDDLYQAGTDAAINDLITRPPPPKLQEPKFSAWKALTAVPKGAAAGALETGAMVPDVADAIGGAFTRAASSMLPKPRAGGSAPVPEFTGASSPEGDALRSAARDFMPDPTAAHAAEQTVFGFAKFGTKAVGSVVALGPAGGAAAVGVNEGLSTADDLKGKGVDLTTRTEVGIVAGLAGSLGVALPVAGKTGLQTAALVAAGGPGAMIGQQLATREILQAADYSKLADQIDPFDPVALAVSTLVPAGFGAWALRGAKLKATAAAADEAARVKIEGEAKAAAEIGPPKPTPEQVDAARVEMLTQHMESSGLYRPEDARAAAMHVEAFARALDDLGAGRRVDVTDLVPAERIEMAKAMDTFVTKLEAGRADLMAQAALRAEPGAVRQMQAELVDTQAKLAELEDPAAIKARAGEIQQAERVSFKQAMAQAKREFQAQADDVRARVDRLETLLGDNATGQQAFDALNLIDRQATQARQQRSQIDAPTLRETPTAQAAREAATTRQEPPANVQDAPQARTDAPAGAAGQPQPAATQPPRTNAPGTGPAGAGEPGAAGVPRTGGADPAQGLVAARLNDVAQQFPDLTVQMDGMDKPMRLSEFLDQVQREAMEGTDADLGGNDASLMQVAASCFLLNG